MPDFWPSCGYRLLATGSDRRLTVTDDFLRSYLARPGARADPGVLRRGARAARRAAASCRARRCAATSCARSPTPDARDNYRIFLRFRDRLLGAPSLEAAYLGLFQGDGVDVPPLFVHQLTQVLLRHILGEGADPLQARCGRDAVPRRRRSP